MGKEEAAVRANDGDQEKEEKECVMRRGVTLMFRLII